MVPNEAFHVTALFVAVPSTVAVNVSLPFVSEVVETGEITTPLTAGFDGALDGAAVTSIVAVANLLGSAMLVAVTEAIPAVAGAV